VDIAGRLAVVTGGGSGMGRELVEQLATGGCDVATCDVHEADLAETLRLTADAAPDARVTAHRCDVSDEHQVLGFRDEVLARHRREHVHLLFNNAGVAGGYSFVAGDRGEWDRTFAICWGGVYHCTRAFLPLMVAADAGYLVNTSSVNGFWAALGPEVPHTAYSTAKFAVKGFSEALITDLRVHAPHVKVAVVMPGHVGTGIVANTMSVLADDESLAEQMRELSDAFAAKAPVSAREAATIILDGVRGDEWRILVGDDARALDAAVRADPDAAYGADGLALRSITG
jgi:NAD(P)-dependent dehydrogenase (short-subunit alcohol dehydrogenase family)